MNIETVRKGVNLVREIEHCEMMIEQIEKAVKLDVCLFFNEERTSHSAYWNPEVEPGLKEIILDNMKEFYQQKMKNANEEIDKL